MVNYACMCVICCTCVREKSHFLRSMQLSLDDEDEYSLTNS